MPEIKFTDKKIRGLKTDKNQEDFMDIDLQGFGIRVTSQGTKTFSVRYFSPATHKYRRYKVGRFPALSLSAARNEARKVIGDVAKGIDPAQEKADSKILTKKITFEELANKYIQEYAKEKKATWTEDERFMDVAFIPVFGKRDADSISRKEIRDLLKMIARRAKKKGGNGGTVNRHLTTIKKMYNWGIEEEYVEKNPCWRMTKLVDVNSNGIVLTPRQLHKLWHALDTQDVRHEAYFKLRLICMQRDEETRFLPKTGEIDRDSNWWTLPGDRTKNGLPNRIFLPTLACEILDKLDAAHPGADYFFPSFFFGGQEPMTISKYSNYRIRKIVGFKFTGRDIRRTAASLLASLGVRNEIIDLLLNHVSTTDINHKHYNFYSYDREKKAAWELWEKYLKLIIAGKFNKLENLSLRPDKVSAKGARLIVPSCIAAG